MKKWGVRLIALFFIIRAVSSIYGLISGTFRVNGFLGFDFTYNGKPTGIMAWVSVAIFLYVGVQLLRFHQSGRDSALFVLGLEMFVSAIFLIWMSVLWVKDFGENKGSGLAWNLSLFHWHSEIRGLSVVIVYFVEIFIFLFIPFYFLKRKNVKQLFESLSRQKNQPISSKEKNHEQMGRSYHRNTLFRIGYLGCVCTLDWWTYTWRIWI
jgi:hypothetical protein